MTLFSCNSHCLESHSFSRAFRIFNIADTFWSGILLTEDWYNFVPFRIYFALNLWLRDLAATAFLSNTEKILSLGILLAGNWVSSSAVNKFNYVARAGSFLSANPYSLPHCNIMLLDAFWHMDSSRSVSVWFVCGLTTTWQYFTKYCSKASILPFCKSSHNFGETLSSSSCELISTKFNRDKLTLCVKLANTDNSVIKKLWI